MELGQRLKQARLEAGMSQRQLCADTITRNMLSLIENGSARPSMDTLRYLAGRLGKPVSYFLQEDVPLSPNTDLLQKARQAAPRQALALLEAYQAPDSLWDPEKYLMEALCCLTLAEQALEEKRQGLARQLLDRAAQAGARSPYYTSDNRRRWLLLCHRAEMATPGQLAAQLPDLTGELLLLARGALEDNAPEQAQAFLGAATTRGSDWHRLQGQVYFARQQYREAAAHWELSEKDAALYRLLETCYRELGDFQQAYRCACAQR